MSASNVAVNTFVIEPISKITSSADVGSSSRSAPWANVRVIFPASRPIATPTCLLACASRIPAIDGST